MNSITRETIERELDATQTKLDSELRQIEKGRQFIREREAARDALASQLGALKEDLARGERDDASQRRFNDLIRSFTAVP